jgi:dienelactone hydrolase
MTTMAAVAKDKRVEIAIHNWAPRFVSAGVPLADFNEVTAAITRWDEWCAVWSERASVHETLGREALDAGYKRSAASHLTRAALCYHFGKFMFVHNMDEMRRAHESVVQCRNLALPHLDPPGERVAIRYESRVLYGILRKPAAIERAAVVIMCVGLDSTKEELDVYEDIFLERGMATLAFDGPGQGEAEYDMPIRGDYEAPVQAVIDFIETRSDLDPDRIGVMGVSLGGYYSARAAAFDKRIAACLSFSGPYSWVEIFDGRNELSREAFRVRSHSRTMDEARDKAKTLTLEGAAVNISCPIYIVAGELDRLTSPANAERIAAEVSGPKVLQIVKGGNHVVNNRRYMYQTQAADWMGQQLSVPES